MLCALLKFQKVAPPEGVDPRTGPDIYWLKRLEEAVVPIIDSSEG